MTDAPWSDRAPDLTIRGHHLLCMLGFRGLGYSPAFVENMTAVVGAFFAEPSPSVQVLARADAICAACPHCADDRCAHTESSDRKVRAKDDAVLSRLGLSPGTRLPASELLYLVADRFGPAGLETLCSGCRWHSYGYCREGLAALHGRAPATADASVAPPPT